MQQTGNTNSDRFKLAFLSFCIACTVYAGVIWNDFTYDDYLVIVNNPYIESPGFVARCFSKEYFYISGEATYRPVVTLLYRFIAETLGKQAVFFHIISVFLHAFTSACIVSLAYSAGVGTWSILPGIFFAVHPVLTEAVCSIAFVEDVLITFFSVIAVKLITSLRDTDSRQKTFFVHFFTAVCFLLAVFSKESGMALAILLPASIIFTGIQNRSLSQPDTKSFLRQQMLYITAWMLPLVLFYFSVRFYLLPGYATTPGWLGGSFLKASLNACVIAMEYLGRLVYPISLSLVRSPPEVKSFIDPLLLIAIVLHVMLALSCVATFRNVPVWSFGVIWFYVSFAPVSNIIPFWNPVADRYVYMIAVGFVLALACLIKELWLCSKSWGKILINCVIVILVSVWTERTVTRVGEWQNNQTLWGKELMLHPSNPAVLAENAAVANQNGDYKKAMELASKALALNPKYATGHYYLAKSLLMMKRYDEALPHYREVIATQKLQTHLYCDALFDMAYMADKVYEDTELAEANYRHALLVDPAYLRAYFNLGELLFRLHKYDEALKIWQTALKFYPSNTDLLHNLKLTERMLQNTKK